MKTSKTETLKECLTNPDIVDYINTEKNFSICRPYHNKNIDFLEKLFFYNEKSLRKIKNYNGKVHRTKKELKSEQEELESIGTFNMTNSQRERIFEIDELLKALENAIKSPLNEVITKVELMREYARRNRKGYKERHKNFLVVLKFQEKKQEKKMKERVYWAMKNIEDAIRKGRDEISLYATSKLSGKELFKKELNKLIKKL